MTTTPNVQIWDIMYEIKPYINVYIIFKLICLLPSIIPVNPSCVPLSGNGVYKLESLVKPILLVIELIICYKINNCCN